METYCLSRAKICELLPAIAMGVYELGFVTGTEFVPTYFGRSRWLRQRLLQHASAAVETHFRFHRTQSMRAAVRLECRAWHLPLPGSRNKIHPALPRGVGPCPYCAVELHGYDLRAAAQVLSKPMRDADLRKFDSEKVI